MDPSVSARNRPDVGVRSECVCARVVMAITSPEAQGRAILAKNQTSTMVSVHIDVGKF